MSPHHHLSRRDFLKMVGAAAGAAALESCLPNLHPAPLPPPSPVSIARANSYDPKLVRRQLQSLFDSLGGLGDLVKSGDTVVLKVNLTGGVKGTIPPPGTTAPESYVTHPVVARAMAELLLDSGAKKIYIVESVWEWASFEEWGYVTMAKDLGVGLLDLNDPAPFADYASLPVGKDWFIYERFKLNHILEEADALVSVAKMKCHYLLGITQSMKNLVGLAPYKFYERKTGDGYRTGFHGADRDIKSRLPRVVMDLNRARKVDLSVIDGIQTVEGSEGPWNQDLKAVSPGLLIGGRNPVSTDAVAVAAMGFDPTAEYPAPPFLRAENHLNLAYRLGLGSNRLNDIEVLGPALDDIKQKFQPAW